MWEVDNNEVTPGAGLTYEEKMTGLFDKYADMMKARSLKWYRPMNSKWDIRKIERFLRNFSIPLTPSDVIAFLDTTILKRATEGMLYTYKGILIKETMNKLYYLEYDKIERAELVEKFDDAGYVTYSKVHIYFKDGTEKTVFDYDIRKTFFVEYINEVVKYIKIIKKD